MVAACDDEWEFLLDPRGAGQDLQWFSPSCRGGNWQRIRTSTASWGDQGLRYYKGEAWYRQTVSVPAAFARRRVFLWCAGVDEKCAGMAQRGDRVSHGAAFVPFELDATPAVRARNTIVICVSNRWVDELGTGGITGPVMLYAPPPGDAGATENRELGRTFP